MTGRPVRKRGAGAPRPADAPVPPSEPCERRAQGGRGLTARSESTRAAQTRLAALEARQVAAPLRDDRDPPRLRLSVQYAVSAKTLPTPARLRRWARAALERDADVTLRFVGEKEGRALNATFRGRDYATNVLTFVYDDSARLAGDIVLCAAVLRREAKAEGKTLIDHCAHLVIHGMLHLQGYDHERPRAATAMERREVEILAALGIADPYTDSSATPKGTPAPRAKARKGARSRLRVSEEKEG